MTDEVAYNVVIKFAIIRKLAVGFDFGKPCEHYQPINRRFTSITVTIVICFELLTPPIFQMEPFNRLLTGDDFRDNRKYRQRLQSLNAMHAAVAPYAHHLRVILHEQRDLEKFCQICIAAKIPLPFRTSVDAESKGFYTDKPLFHLRRQLQQFEWSVAFQIETLLRNGLMNTDELTSYFMGRFNKLCVTDPMTAPETLRLFTEALRTRDTRQSIRKCFEEVVARDVPEAPRVSQGLFRCHHVTVTPSRMVLEGPFVIQSNRVIRKYEGFEENFIRVDFRDEDRLQYRWEPDVSARAEVPFQTTHHLLVDRWRVIAAKPRGRDSQGRIRARRAGL